VLKTSFNVLVPSQRAKLIRVLEKEMLEHATNLEFERAALLRDEIAQLREM